MGARVKSACVLRPHLVALQTSHSGDIVPRLAVKPGVSDIGAEDFSVVLELVNFRVEGALDIREGAVGADGEADGVGGQNG